MKTFEVTYWRNNPQLKNGGYQKTRPIEAKNLTEAWLKAYDIAEHVAYGSIEIIDVKEAIKND